MEEGENGVMMQLGVDVKDIPDGSQILFQIWTEGQDPNSDIPLQVVKATVAGGSAKAMWCLQFDKVIPDNDLRLFYTAHSALCPYLASDVFTVTPRRATITRVLFRDKDGNDVESVPLGGVLWFVAEGDKNMKDGDQITFRVYSEGDDPSRDPPKSETTVPCENGKATVETTCKIKLNPEKPLNEEFRFFITANGPRCKKIVKSGLVVVEQDYSFIMKDRVGEILPNTECRVVFSSGTEETATSDSKGYVSLLHKIPGNIISAEAKMPDGDIVPLF